MAKQILTLILTMSVIGNVFANGELAQAARYYPEHNTCVSHNTSTFGHNPPQKYSHMYGEFLQTKTKKY